MKTIIILVIAGLCISINTSAQYGRYGGRNYGGYRGDRYGSPGTMRSQPSSIKMNYNQIIITDFPEITDLTLKQNLDLSAAVTDEKKNILKLMDQKQEIQEKIDRAKNQKEVEKHTKKIAKVDEKMQKVSQKAEKKFRTILTSDQFNEFVEKKELIKFDFIPNIGARMLPPG